jgi:hypothetical protein
MEVIAPGPLGLALALLLLAVIEREEMIVEDERGEGIVASRPVVARLVARQAVRRTCSHGS